MNSAFPVATAAPLRSVWTAVRGGAWHDWWLGPAGGAVVAALAWAYRSPALRPLVIAAAVPNAHLDLLRLLVRLPLSMFAPAKLLPFGFAVLQVTVVFAAAQILLGPGRTLTIGLAGHAAATISARAWIRLGPPLGVAHTFAYFPDAGPSVAVICLGGYIAVRWRIWWLAAALFGYHAVETAIFNGLSQREHLVGVLVGVLIAASETGTGMIGRGRPRHPPGPEPCPHPTVHTRQVTVHRGAWMDRLRLWRCRGG